MSMDPNTDDDDGPVNEADDEDRHAAHARQRTMNTATPCPKCGRVPEYETDYMGYIVSCCFDGADDAGPQLAVHGTTLELAVKAWNEKIEEETPAPCACGHPSDVHAGSGCAGCSCAGWQAPVEVG